MYSDDIPNYVLKYFSKNFQAVYNNKEYILHHNLIHAYIPAC